MDVATAQAWVDSWLAVQTGLQANTSYTIAFPNGTTRTVSREDSEEVRRWITYWTRVANSLDAGARGAKEQRYVTPSWT